MSCKEEAPIPTRVHLQRKQANKQQDRLETSQQADIGLLYSTTPTFCVSILCNYCLCDRLTLKCFTYVEKINKRQVHLKVELNPVINNLRAGRMSFIAEETCYITFAAHFTFSYKMYKNIQ